MILAIHLPKMGPLQRGKREKEPRKNHYCWCWVDGGVIPADWPMKSDNSEG